jgi:hypothetical protein
MIPQHTMRGVSGGYSTFVFQICLPVLASISFAVEPGLAVGTVLRAPRAVFAVAATGKRRIRSLAREPRAGRFEVQLLSKPWTHARNCQEHPRGIAQRRPKTIADVKFDSASLRHIRQAVPPLRSSWPAKRYTFQLAKY